MSSPAPSNSGAEAKKPLEQITFRFCSECSNMLYPKEDDNDHRLMFTCRTCNFSEEAKSTCIFRNVLNNAAGETAGVTQDVGSDPTVGTSSVASRAIPSSSSSSSSHGHHCVYVCCLTCGRMITCEICGAELATLPIESLPDTTIEQQQANNFMQLDQDEADICLVEESTERHLASVMAQNSHYFGELMEEDDEEAMGFESENIHQSQPYLLLPRKNITCPACNHDEAVFFQSQQRSAETGMKLFFVCCDCGNIFQS
ncbi:hypothetical protein QBC35DRAFT_384653 [Podospora australis]|uniref:DNA-directed RNA polymerase II subunit RPB9 n=1 Tax=Podospora australis TaxID=1536484 RepID=A0AAN6WT69_9PEZI|nr:hypothetical protein QBC35DRAFT_384653 [Podospora australis]